MDLWPISSGSAVGAGNTRTAPKRQVSPSVRWVFTLNNWTEEEYSSIQEIIIYKCKYAIIGKEGKLCGATPHLQGYIEFKRKNRPFGVFQNERIHWEKARGSREKQTYCGKEGDVWEYPSKWKQTIEEFYEWEKIIVNELKIKDDTENRKINWIWESTGCAGKTVFQKWVHQNFDGVMALSGKGDDMKNGIVEYQKKMDNLPKIIFINVPRVVETNYVSYNGIEQIKDMFFYSGKYEGGMVNGPSPKVYVFANEEPVMHKMSNDRWVIREISDENLLEP